MGRHREPELRTPIGNEVLVTNNFMERECPLSLSMTVMTLCWSNHAGFAQKENNKLTGALVDVIMFPQWVHWVNASGTYD